MAAGGSRAGNDDADRSRHWRSATEIQRRPKPPSAASDRDEQDGADADPPRPPEVAERRSRKAVTQPSSFTKRRARAGRAALEQAHQLRLMRREEHRRAAPADVAVSSSLRGNVVVEVARRLVGDQERGRLHIARASVPAAPRPGELVGCAWARAESRP